MLERYDHQPSALTLLIKAASHGSRVPLRAAQELLEDGHDVGALYSFHSRSHKMSKEVAAHDA